MTALLGELISRKLEELVSVRDFGAIGDGVADDTAALQRAVDSVSGQGAGAVLHFPLGRYVISSTLMVHVPIHLNGTGFGDVTGTNTNIPQNPNTALVWKAGSGAHTMVHFVSARPNETLHGGGLKGIYLDANNEAATCLRVSSARESEFDLGTFRPTVQGVLLDDTNGRLLDSVRISRLVARIGGNSAAAGAHGIYIKGNVSGGQFGCTNVWMEDIDIEYDTGDGILFEEVDSCTVVRLKGSERRLGASPGHAAAFLNGGGGQSFPAQKNVIVHLARGRVRVEDRCIGNRVLYWNSEGGGSTLQGSSNFNYTVTDRIHGDTFQGGMIYPMKENFTILPGALQKGGGARDAGIGEPGWGGVELQATGSSSVKFSLPPIDTFNNGKIFGVRIHCFPSVGASRNDVRLTLQMIAIPPGRNASGVERSRNLTVQLAGGRGTLKVIDLLFRTNQLLNYHRGEWLAGIVKRSAGHNADTSPQGFIIGGLQILYQCDGPDGGGSGPWQVPVNQLA